MKKIAKLFAHILIVSMLFSATVLAEEPVIDMTYDQWQEEQANISSDFEEVDMDPVRVESDEDSTVQVQSTESIESTGDSEMRLLESVLKDVEKVELDEEISTDKTAESLTDSISIDIGNARTAPTASLIPIILNEETLKDGKITTDTQIGFVYNDSDEDSDTIVNRYVGGSAADYIWAEIEEGFIIQITVPGTYELYYQVEDSSGEMSEAIGFRIEVISATSTEEPEEPEKYQVFEGSFTSAEDTATYNFSVDFSQMDSASVCLVRKGYVGTLVKVYDEAGNEVLYRGTSVRQAKNWGYIDRPSEEATVCNYTVVAKPDSYENRASDYRIIVGDKKETELMMSGMENTVLLDQYYDEKLNLQNNLYIPNVGEYWYKYRRNPTSIITVLSTSSTLRFKLYEADTMFEVFDSAEEPDTHRTKFVGESHAWASAEKARLTTEVGKEYYLVVYCINPASGMPIVSGSMATAVGNPVMCPATTTIFPQISVTATRSEYSSTRTFEVNGDNIPKTGRVSAVDLKGVRMSDINRWRLMAPEKSLWFANVGNSYPRIDFNYVKDSEANAKLKGTWSMGFQSSSSSCTFTPSFYIIYYYEYGD